MRMPSANRECATCHVMWLTDFKREDVTTLIPYDPMPVMDTGKEDVSSTDPMCFSCHDGFVLESRYLWETGGHTHPVGQKPSEKIHIPKEDGKNIFPLNEDGNIYCGTCHSAHGVDWEQDKSAVFMRVRNDDGKLCMACHEDKTKGPKHGMHPVKKKIQKLMSSPPKDLMAAGALFSHEGEVICQSCHKAHVAKEKKLLLVKNNESQLCGECHIHRYANNLSDLGRLGTHPVNVKPRHLTIPDKLIEGGAKLGTDGEVICETCHRPHNALPATSLLVNENKKDSLCQSCHSKELNVLQSKHDMTLVNKDSKNIRKQTASNSGACSACHVPHRGTGPKMWARPVEKGLEPMASLCLSCHTNQGMAEKHTVGEFSHPVGANVSRLEHTVKLPAYSKTGLKTVGKKQGAVSCASCHDPHQWDARDPEIKGEPGKEGSSFNRFLRITNDSQSTLCKVCHQEKWKIAGSKHDLRYMAPKTKNTLGQTVAQSGICGSCHLVHNANAPGLWARSNPEDQHKDYIACTGCHNKEGLAKDKTVGKHSHPLNVGIEKVGIKASGDIWTRISPSVGKKNKQKAIQKLSLYDEAGKPVHIGGNIGCGSCHDPHSWSVLNYKKPKHPKNMEGDANTSFLKIPDQGQSRLCVNCHQDNQSVINTLHDLTEENSKNKSKPGVCTHCHLPHNAKDDILSARDTGSGKTTIAKMCNACHQKDGMAKDKITGKHSHPLGVSMPGSKQIPRLPLFDTKGRKVDHDGYVDCSTCHNPHQWDPLSLKNRKLKLKAKEGDASNSFLRVRSTGDSDLCVSCHKDKKTIRRTDHDLAITAPKDKNIQGQGKNKSGVCGQCHTPHNAEDSLYMWARKLGKGNDPIEKRCRSCHDVNQSASKKNPIMASHPEEVRIWSPELRRLINKDQVSNIIAFDERGKRAAYGSITCASCHDPHQWDASKDKRGPGYNLEGNIDTSFLRTDKTAGMVCVDCHGKDSLYRYKYFHSETAYKKHHMFK